MTCRIQKNPVLTCSNLGSQDSGPSEPFPDSSVLTSTPGRPVFLSQALQGYRCPPNRFSCSHYLRQLTRCRTTSPLDKQLPPIVTWPSRLSLSPGIAAPHSQPPATVLSLSLGSRHSGGTGRSPRCSLQVRPSRGGPAREKQESQRNRTRSRTQWLDLLHLTPGCSFNCLGAACLKPTFLKHACICNPNQPLGVMSFRC